jgi:hypothetical protein
VECNRLAAAVLQCGLGLHDSQVRRIRNGGGLKTMEWYTITSLEGEASRPGGTEADRPPLALRGGDGNCC